MTKINQSTDNKLFFFEINEFNFDLMKSISERLQLTHLNKLLNSPHSVASIPDHYDSDFLEPWAQWVSIHTGQPAAIHQIKHLGDVPELHQKQLWEAFSDKNISVGVWGVMNGSKREAKNCKFFMPDPWTFSENGSPDAIANLLKLPRYLAKNYLNISTLEVIKLIPSFLNGLKVVPFQFDILKEFTTTMFNAFKYNFADFVFISFFDFLTTKAFIKLAYRYETEVNVFFINLIAHAQHHYWNEENMDRVEYCYRYLNKIVALLDTHGFFSSKFVVTNGLTQKNTNEEPAWILYRQNQPENFFKSLNLGIVSIEQLMTHDSHLFFESEEKCTQAFKVFSKVTINNSQLFFCEKNSANPKKLFIRLNFFDPIDNDIELDINGYKFMFLKAFRAIVRRTGKHIQKTDIISNLIQLTPDEMNYSIFHKTLSAYK